MRPDTAALPLPIDIDWPAKITDRAAAFRRMTVAYGLSFGFLTLAQHRFPAEIESLPANDEPPREPYHAPSKDEV